MKIKKLISAICALAAAAAVIPSAANAAEIRFRVGDSALSINGNSVEVETPYVVGSGVTLVPVRVISEAFGAEVVWDGETQTVMIMNGGTQIALQIGNKTAFVNGAEISLEEAPELTENGFTMVPLRFISESLGALVDYDDQTREITVSSASDNSVAVRIGNFAMNKSELKIYVDEFLSYGMSIDYAQQYAVNAATNMLSLEAVFAAEGLSFTDEEKAAQQSEKELLIYDGFGYEYGYREYLAENGITDAFVDRVIAAAYMQEKLFADDISEEGVKKFYNDNYLHAKHILISAVDENGTPQKGLADELLARAKAGEDFDALIVEYSEDPGSLYYPEGYYFTAGEMVPEFEDITRSLGMNEIGICESVYGYHIIMRLPLDKSAVDEQELNQQIIQYIFDNKLPALLEKHGLTVEVDQAVIDSLAY